MARVFLFIPPDSGRAAAPAPDPPCRPSDLVFKETRVEIPGFVLEERKAEFSNLLRGSGATITETKLKLDKDGDLTFEVQTGGREVLHGTICLANRGELLWQESRCLSDMLELFRPGTRIDHATVQSWERRMASDSSNPKEFTGCNIHRGRTQVQITPLKKGSRNSLQGDATIVDVRFSISPGNCISVQFGAKGAGRLQYSIHLPTVGPARPGLLVSEIDALQEILRMSEEGEPVDERKFFNIGLALHKTFNLVITPDRTTMYVIPTKSPNAQHFADPWARFIAPAPLAIAYPGYVHQDESPRTSSSSSSSSSPSSSSSSSSSASRSSPSGPSVASSTYPRHVHQDGPTRPSPSPSPSPSTARPIPTPPRSGTSDPSRRKYPNIEMTSPVYMKGDDRPQVWKAQLVSDQKTVAVKIFPVEQRKDFEYEKEILEKLPPHPNIVKLHKTHEGPEKPCLVLEWIQGGTLDSYIASYESLQGAKMTARIAIHIIRQIAVGLQHLHKNSILHRDMKSPNIMIDDSGAGPGQVRAVIIDLGLGAQTKATAAAQSFLTMRMSAGEGGTLFWEAPETIMNGEYSNKSDIYSLGVILWELLAHQTPFRDKEIKGPADEFQFRMAVVRPIHESPLRPNLSIIARAPPRLISLITRCWHPDPRFRPPIDLILGVLDEEAACMSYEDLVAYRQSMNLQSVLDNPSSYSLQEFTDLCGQLPPFLSLSPEEIRRAFASLTQGPSRAGASSSAPAGGSLPSHLVVLFIDNVLVRGSDQVFKRLETEAHHTALDQELFPRQRRVFNTELRQEWSVRGWLGSIGLPQYAGDFEKEDITHQYLTDPNTMTDFNLKDLGVDDPAHRRLMMERAKDIPKLAPK